VPGDAGVMTDGILLVLVDVWVFGSDVKVSDHFPNCFVDFVVEFHTVGSGEKEKKFRKVKKKKQDKFTFHRKKYGED
jgi:hypothetical protein